ncbi:MAG TPA: hypothetical protein ENJ12_00975 [Thiolapillus brandeum]|uniref:Alpha/beta hydrolase n=1 Tax=Thiolapillus brandeum TaxID=1076588 RepID=A0A831RUY0_9GAMM|nr:hypothetical protein [Thiolapillus brandeum]
MTRTFDQCLKDDSAAVAIDLRPGCDRALVAFGGIQGAMGVPPFEFFNLTNKLDVGKIYVRDLRQAWYHQGLSGVTTDIEGTAAFLANELESVGSPRTVLVGNSMGGYAAILFGLLLNVDTVHVFSPQTFIDKANRSLYRDNRWPRQIDRVHGGHCSRYMDLRHLLQRLPESRSRIHIHYSVLDAMDEIHARHLAGFHNVSLHAYKRGGHEVVRHLKSTGVLGKLLSTALDVAMPDQRNR